MSEYFRAIAPSLPEELAIQLEQLCHGPSTEPLIDALIRFVCGAGCPETLSDSIRSQWLEKQQEAKRALCALFPSSLDLKRPREGEHEQHVDKVAGSKRRRLTPPSSDATMEERSTPEDVGQPIFTLCAVSVTSPVRKKVDITIHRSALRFVSSGAHSIEAIVSLSSLRRAFLLPTRGKTKAHWTIVLTSSDTPDRAKPNSSSSQAFPQVIFGIDATMSLPLITMKYDDNSEPIRETVPKGSATLPSLKTFLLHLGMQILEPTSSVFKSACSGYGANAGEGGIPGVEAYRAAKVGSLWFMKEGILWGESKPCEFWAVEDLLGKSEGLRLLANAGGRTCSVILTRKSSDEIPADEEDVGVETEFAMIDSREQDGINQWVRAHRHLFGKKGTGKEEKIDQSLVAVSRGPMTIHEIGDGSDNEDEDFEMASSVEDGSSDSCSDSEDEQSEHDNSEDEARDSDAEGENEDDELKEEIHPLLRRGAVPRMSKAAMDMVVTMVEEDFLGRAKDKSEEDSEEDELDE